MPNEKVPLMLRLPPEIHVRLVAAARDSDRSLNSEIVNRLRLSFADWKRL